MAEASTLRGVLGFFVDIGIYDVVLPFLLVFTIVFAIFDKTKVLGTEVIDGHKYPKKNLNAIVAFVILLSTCAMLRVCCVAKSCVFRHQFSLRKLLIAQIQNQEKSVSEHQLLS